MTDTPALPTTGGSFIRKPDGALVPEGAPVVLSADPPRPDPTPAPAPAPPTAQTSGSTKKKEA